MLFLTKRPDGGPASNVMGYWVIEIKWLFTIVLLHFKKGCRENFHSHAFNALTFWLKGSVEEEVLNSASGKSVFKKWKASLWPKYTRKNCVHRVHVDESAWALSFRGPWEKEWDEFTRHEDGNVTRTRLANHRQVVDTTRYFTN